MIRSIKELYGNKLGASDGEIGHVKDLYFDDHNWAVRYVVADTGSWLTGRQVLLSPHAFGRFHQAGNVLSVNLTRNQIENSPSIALQEPVSRQYEEEYHRYYGWPYYWQGTGLWGMSGFPILETPGQKTADGPAVAVDPPGPPADPHLRSAQAVKHYHIRASDGVIGHLCDLMMDDGNWSIQQLAINTGHLISAREVQIPVSAVERISYRESTIYVNLTMEVIEQSPAHHWVPVGAAA